MRHWHLAISMLVVILQRLLLTNITWGRRTTKWRMDSGALVIQLRYLPRLTGGRREVRDVLRVGKDVQEQRHRDICERKRDDATKNDACDGFVDQEEEMDEANEEKGH